MARKAASAAAPSGLSFGSVELVPIGRGAAGLHGPLRCETVVSADRTASEAIACDGDPIGHFAALHSRAEIEKPTACAERRELLGEEQGASHLEESFFFVVYLGG